MKLLIGAAALAAAGLVSAAPAAAENYYALGLSYEEIGLSHLSDFTVTPPDIVQDAGVPVLNALVGWKGDQWYGAEVELGLGLSAGDVVSNSAAVNIRQSAAIYGVVHYPVSEALDLHARAGLIHQVSKLSDSGQPVIAKESGLSYGVGASYTINTELTLRFDYTQHDIDFGYEVAPGTIVSSDGAHSLALTVVKKF